MHFAVSRIIPLRENFWSGITRFKERKSSPFLSFWLREIFFFKKKKKTARYIRADLDIKLMYGKSFRFLNKAFQ